MAWSKAKQMKFLSDAPVIRVATANRSCKPQVTPVCHVVWKDKIYWASDFDAAKLANLQHHRVVALVADVYKANWQNMGGVMVQGPAKMIRKGPLFLEIRKRLYKKFKVYKSNAGFGSGGISQRVSRVEADHHGLGYSVGKLTTTVRRDRRGASVLFCAAGKENGDDGSGSRRGAEGERD